MQTINLYYMLCLYSYLQGWKPEKNLRFLLQKVLKQSDVGNLGRIVLPKVIYSLTCTFDSLITSLCWNFFWKFASFTLKTCILWYSHHICCAFWAISLIRHAPFDILITFVELSFTKIFILICGLFKTWTFDNLITFVEISFKYLHFSQSL